ncbi:MAG TPA: hypothetical protein VJ550_04385 [Geomonas sp.]|nr:hypothetical protein [Geomonas sp.]
MTHLALLRRALFLLAISLLPLPAFAASQLTISPSGGGVFAVTGKLEAVAGLQIAITYDGTLLSNPRITSGDLITGHGMIAVPNATSNPIQLAAVSGSAVTASGTVATITFDTASTSSGGITAFSASAIDINYKPVRIAYYNNAGSAAASADPAASPGSTSGSVTSGDPASAGGSISWNPAGTVASGDAGGSGNLASGTADGSGTNSTAVTTATIPRSAAPVLGGSVSLPPADPGATGQENRVANAPAAEQESQPPPAATDPKVAVAEKTAPVPDASEAEAPARKVSAAPQKPVESVLERFRLFQGEKNVKNLSALFEHDPAASFTQLPAIALADGASTVKVVVSNLSGDQPPAFSLSSAQYVAMERVGDREWELEVRPEKGAVKATVKLFSKGGTQELPLTVTPKADIAPRKKGAADESDFRFFLKERGTASAPKFDLNGDGKRDYLDDYIYTANYLIKRGEQAPKKQAAQQKQ